MHDTRIGSRFCTVCGRKLGRNNMTETCSANCARLALISVLRPPSRPTSAPPGSRQKVEVMRARIARGEECFHPNDAGY